MIEEDYEHIARLSDNDNFMDIAVRNGNLVISIIGEKHHFDFRIFEKRDIDKLIKILEKAKEKMWLE